MDEPSEHFPDRIEIELHIDRDNLTRSTEFSILLYRNGKSIWRQGLDTAGEIDVAVIEIERDALPDTTVYRAFTPEHLHRPSDQVEVGTALLVVGFPRYWWWGSRVPYHDRVMGRFDVDRRFEPRPFSGNAGLDHETGSFAADAQNALGASTAHPPGRARVPGPSPAPNTFNPVESITTWRGVRLRGSQIVPGPAWRRLTVV